MFPCIQSSTHAGSIQKVFLSLFHAVFTTQQSLQVLRKAKGRFKKYFVSISLPCRLLFMKVNAIVEKSS